MIFLSAYLSKGALYSTVCWRLLLWRFLVLSNVMEVGSQFLEALKARLGGAMESLRWCGAALSIAERLEQNELKIPSIQTCSVMLCNIIGNWLGWPKTRCCFAICLGSSQWSVWSHAEQCCPCHLVCCLFTPVSDKWLGKAFSLLNSWWHIHPIFTW